MRPLLALLLLAASASAAPTRPIDIEREEYRIVGWNDACAVAIERYAYPYLGKAIHSEPITSRVGTLSVLTKLPIVETRWVYEADGAGTYDRGAIERMRRQTRKAGYDRPGFAEVIRDSVTVEAPGSAEVILSTAIFDARPDFWPDTTQWRLGAIRYNPLTSCALLIYDKIGERDRFKFILTRFNNPSARSERARAHTTNGRLLFNNGDLTGALAETESAAKTAPEIGAVRYHHAAMLTLNGRLEDGIKELEATIKIDPRFRAKAKKDVDFDSLRGRQDFQELVLEQDREPAPVPP